MLENREENSCKFCSDFALLKRPNSEAKNAGLNLRYKVAIIEEIYKGKYFRGSTRYGGYKLKFCPECGKRISGRNDKR